VTTQHLLHEQYDVYDIAYLAGGLRRVADTALVALLQDGRIRREPTGELATVDPRRRHPVEAAVLDVVGPRPRRSAGTVRWRLEGDRRLAAVAERLTADGLLGRPRRLLLPRRPARPALTGTGRRVLREWRERPPADRVAGNTEALPVALHGLTALSDAEMRTALLPPVRTVRRSGAAHWDARAEATWSLLPAGGWGGDAAGATGHGGSFGHGGCDGGHAGFGGGHGGFDGGGHGGC
jgi:hypothetical protein